MTSRYRLRPRSARARRGTSSGRGGSRRGGAGAGTRSHVLGDRRRDLDGGLPIDLRMGIERRRPARRRSTSPSPIPTGLPATLDIVVVSGGGSQALALIRDGSVYAWGQNRVGELGTGAPKFSGSLTPVQTAMPPGVTATAVSAGGDFSLETLKASMPLADDAALFWFCLGDQSRPPVSRLQLGNTYLGVHLAVE